MSTFTHAVSTNNYGPAKFIVDASAANGTHTTIATALTSASSGDTIFIRPGTYTENITLKAGVNLTAYGSDSSLNGTGKVIISGTCTMTTAGTVTISGIQLQTNSAALLAVTGSEASIVNLSNCYLNCTNNTGITYSSSSASSAINIYNCQGNIGTTGISLFTDTASGPMMFKDCSFFNTGGASTTSSTSVAGVTFNNCNLVFPLSTSSTGAYQIQFTNIDSSGTNTASLTTAGTGASNVLKSGLGSGTAVCISVGAGTTVNLYGSSLNTSNTNATSGAGSLNYMNVILEGSAPITATTLIGGVAKGGVIQAPSAGFIGEVLTASANAAGIGTGTATNVTSISVTPGIWDISGMGVFTGTITGTTFRLGINSVSATMPGSPGILQQETAYAPTAASNNGVTICPRRIVVTATTTYYLVAVATFTAGTLGCQGVITATRVG